MGDHRMTRRAVAVGLGALVITTVAFVFANTAHATVQPCNVSNVVVYGSGKRATFTVQGSCTVSLVSYERHGNGLARQTLFDSSTKEFSCSTLSASAS